MAAIDNPKNFKTAPPTIPRGFLAAIFGDFRANAKLTNFINDPTFETSQIPQMPDLKERSDVVSQR